MSKKKWWKGLLGFLFFFLPIVLVVGTSIVAFEALQKNSGDNSTLIVLVMLGLCLLFSFAAALVEFFRHKWQVERRVQEILQGTERIAQGDFSVRFTVEHEWGYYDDFDRIKENLNTLVKELSKTELLHSDFVSSVSHEIKTPLTVIKTYASILAKGGKSQETMERHAMALVQASDRLTELVTNILKLNKLENGELLPECKVIDASECLAESILALETMIDEKGLNVETDIKENVLLSAPEGYWAILCNNLLSNAVKFTDNGGKIRVSLKIQNEEIVLTVADSGCGISREEGKRIFDKFYQADTSRKEEGNGLGLALVKKVIERMGGEISVESEVGKGSVFTVRLRKL